MRDKLQNARFFETLRKTPAQWENDRGKNLKRNRLPRSTHARAEEASAIELNLNMDEFSHPERAENSLNNDRFFIYAKKSCPRRSLDALRLQRYLVENKWQPVSNPRNADFIFVYTCGSFDYYEKRSISTIEKALENKSAKVIVTGCLPKVDPAVLDKYKTIHTLSPEDSRLSAPIQANFSFNELNDFSTAQGIHDLQQNRLLKRITPKNAMNFARYSAQKLWNLPKRGEKCAEQVLFSEGTYRIEIGRGCLGDCSYCSIRIGMPKFESRPEEQILEEFKAGLKDNYKTFALIAGDIGCYGFDINTNLPSLLSGLFAVDGDYKIMLWDFNIRWLMKYYSEMFPILKANHEKVERIILPIQSGSNRILKLMNRHYEIEEVKNCLINLHKSIPDLTLETQIIVGFPGETDEDFHKSLDLVREIDFYDIAIFPYEDRPGTIASNMPNRVPENVIKKRKKILREEIERKKKSRTQPSHIGLAPSSFSKPETATPLPPNLALLEGRRML